MPLPALSNKKPPAAPDPFISICQANAYAIHRALSKIERKALSILSPQQTTKVKGLLKEAARLQRMCNQLSPDFTAIVKRFTERLTIPKPQAAVAFYSLVQIKSVTVIAPLHLPVIREAERKPAPAAKPARDLHLMRLTDQFGFAAS